MASPAWLDGHLENLQIAIDDKPTYELFGRGDTTSVFQFESEGMKKYLQQLRPERFEDLIAMNALYRPGPMDYIPDFVARKQGEQTIEYDLPEMEDYLKDTYGVTVYQEQVMLLSQRLAGFTKGEADKLRKAMGKKQIDILNSLKDKFMTGGMANGHPEKTLDKIWKDWEKFAQYAFNKSHSTCYAWISYQTGWLKCHYTAEFFASCLSCARNMDEIKKIIDDCKSHRIKVLNPDVNESSADFSVNSEGNIRYALSAMKGFGSNIVDAIIEERRKNGLFADVFDFVERMGSAVNRKALETLVYAGAFDSFNVSRSRYFASRVKDGAVFLDELARYGELFQNNNIDSSTSLFGEMEELKPTRPEFPPEVLKDDSLFLLQQEKEYVGRYLSSHPLDRYEFEFKTFITHELADLPAAIADAESKKKAPEKVTFAGIVTDVQSSINKTGKPYARAKIEDYSGSYEIGLFGKDYETFLPYMKPHEALFVEGEIKERFFLRPEEKAAGKTVPYTLRLLGIQLLGNVAESKLSGFSIELSTSMLSPEFRASLVTVLKRHKGKMALNIFLRDEKTGYRIRFFSKGFQVSVTTALIDDLKAIGITACEPMLK